MPRKNKRVSAEPESGTTIRACDKRMRDRFYELTSAINICTIIVPNAGAVADVRCRLENIIATYNMRTIHYLSIASATESSESDISNKYFNIVIGDDYDTQIAAICSAIDHLVITFASGCSTIDRVKIEEHIRHAIEWTNVPTIHKNKEDVMRCCGMPMHIFQESSEAVCACCGIIMRIEGIIFKDEQIFSQDTSKGRRSGYVYMRHLKIWLDRLQAIESFIPAAEDIQKLQKAIQSDRVGRVEWRILSYEEVARYISLCHLSAKLGEHIPKTMKCLGARPPPVLDYDTIQIVTRDFVNTMDVYAQLYPEPGNKPYYPFFIKKIIQQRFGACLETDNEDHLIVPMEEAKKACALLDYIESQERDTVIKNDKIYKNICQHAPAEYDLRYVPEII